MNDKITATGLVATTPRHLITQDGIAITSFRLASKQREFDRNLGKWTDGATNWYTVTAFNTLAVNASLSVRKGDRITVTGKLRVRDWDNGERAGTSVEIEADSMGHDLAWGTSVYTRTQFTNPDIVEPEAPERTQVTATVKHDCDCIHCEKS